MLCSKRAIWYSVVTLAGIAAGLSFTQSATATNARVTTSQCRTYALVQHMMTNGKIAKRKSFAACQRKSKVIWLDTPMTCIELGPTMCAVRACESGKRTSNNTPVLGTYDYKAENDTSTASGGWQYLDTTWGGTEGFGRALNAPPRVQDQRALRDFGRSSNSASPTWDESKDCWN